MSNEKKVTMSENIRGLKMVAKTYKTFEKLAKEQIKKDDDLTEEDFYDVVIGLLVTKLLVSEGRLEEKFWDSAIS